MIVALHSAPKGFFKTSPPHSNNDLVSFVRKAASLGFKAVQIGPLTEYVPIEGEHLKNVLDSLKIERNVHVGGTRCGKACFNRRGVCKSTETNTLWNNAFKENIFDISFRSPAVFCDEKQIERRASIKGKNSFP